MFAIFLYGITYFNFMNKPIVECLDMIATFPHKILHKNNIMSPNFFTFDHFNLA